jgi:hypothetical protein
LCGPLSFCKAKLIGYGSHGPRSREIFSLVSFHIHGTNCVLPKAHIF